MTQMERTESFENLRESFMKMWDAGFAEGLELDFMLADTKDYVATLGEPMDNVVEMFWAQWREYRGIA